MRRVAAFRVQLARVCGRLAQWRYPDSAHHDLDPQSGLMHLHRVVKHACAELL